MLKEMPLLRAPEKSRTGMEIKPNVKYPDQTEAAINSPRIRERRQSRAQRGEFNVSTGTLMQEPMLDESKEKARRVGGRRRLTLAVVVTSSIRTGLGARRAFRTVTCH